MTRLWPLVLLVACGGELTVEPVELDWGTVDFNAPLPDSGHEPLDLLLINSGSGSLTVVVTDFDDDRLTITGQLDDDDPITVVLDPDETSALNVGVSGYEAGELDQEVTGTLTLAAKRLSDDIIVPWSYTPQREAPSD